MINAGVDIILNSRFEKLIKDNVFLEKVFQTSELRDKRKLIGKFALKEAVMKALGKKINWKDIEISSIGQKPKIILNDSIKPEGFRCVEGSISHDGDYTIAFVILESYKEKRKK